ncbi:unnamed protein product [Cylicocyclus nassatus]|uniref:Uncharacterized protein n=1 Tax=Cylicocyclus nassatus TaxID=53992 RepID=A0AA36H0B3_CYLNA|nr:unnamed protein product [Cylicocyclus nassatus]
MLFSKILVVFFIVLCAIAYSADARRREWERDCPACRRGDMRYNEDECRKCRAKHPRFIRGGGQFR